MIFFALPLILSQFFADSLLADTRPPMLSGAALTVVLHHVQTQRPGELTCALFAAPEGFPMHAEKALASAKATGQSEERRCQFPSAIEGEYAVSVVHDEDGNGKLNTNIFGAPTEGWATSGNVTHALRAPSFAESKFRFSVASPTVDLEMHY